MDKDVARETLSQLDQYTKAISKFVGVSCTGKSKNHSGPCHFGRPFGAINHFTYSNSAVSSRNPYGRIPILLNRFARGSNQGVGVQFIVWDHLVPRFVEFRSRFSLLKDMPSEVFFFGDDLAFWHAGWVNQWTYGVEIRNCGRLLHKDGVCFWGSKGLRYEGRPPIKIGNSWWEPYSKQQITATLWIHRLMASVHDIKPQWFLGHYHVANTRTDPGIHFPLREMREYALFDGKKDIPINGIAFLSDHPLDIVETDGGGLIDTDNLADTVSRNDAMDGADPSFDPEVIPEFRRVIGTSNVKRKLAYLGYYPGLINDEINTQYVDTLKAFQGRWKVRGAHRRFENELEITGEFNPETGLKLDQMIVQYDSFVR